MPLIALILALTLWINLGAVAETLTPTWPTTSWAKATGTQVGANQAKLDDAVAYARGKGGAGLVVVKGYRVAAWGSQTDRFDLKSTTKSFGLALLGLAIADGRVTLTDRAQKLLPELGTPPSSNVNTGWLPLITVAQLASHTAGFDKPGGFEELLFRPGSKWFYTDGGVNWLADVVTVRLRTDLLKALRERVLNKIGVTSTMLTWRTNAYRPKTLNGYTRREFGSGISASVDAMARFGLLIGRGGLWRGTRILPADLVAQSGEVPAANVDLPLYDTTKYPGCPRDYGLLWWNNSLGVLPNVPRDARWAWGLNDSFILVVPSQDLVVARAGPAWGSPWGNLKTLEPFFVKITGALPSTAAKAEAALAVGRAVSRTRCVIRA